MKMKNKVITVVIGILIASSLFMYGLKKPFGKDHGITFDINKISLKGDIIPIAIIGSGPAGLSVALYGARAKIKTVVIEGNKPGGLLMEAPYVENWPGKEPTFGAQIINDLKEQVESYGVPFLDDVVVDVDFSHWPFELYMESGEILHALSVIIATGAQPRKLGIPGEREYWGKGVASCAICDARFYEKKDVIVVGGGDSAVEKAMQLASYAKQITILVRKDRMRSALSIQERLARYPHIKVMYNVEVQCVIGNGKHVTGVELVSTKTQRTYHMPIDGIFLAIGHEPNTHIFKEFLKTDEQGYIEVKGRSQATSVPGIFAAGDVEDDRYCQAGVASGSGIRAGLDAVAFLNEVGLTPERII